DPREWLTHDPGRRAATPAGERPAGTPPIRVGSVDDHPAVIVGTMAILRASPDITVAAAAGSVDALLAVDTDRGGVVERWPGPRLARGFRGGVSYPRLGAGPARTWRELSRTCRIRGRALVRHASGAWVPWSRVVSAVARWSGTRLAHGFPGHVSYPR